MLPENNTTFTTSHLRGLQRVKDMESVIIEEMRAFLRLDLPDRQRQYFTDTIAVAKRVEVVKAADVFDEREIELIRRTVRPVVKECYKNAHLLTLLFPDRVQYVEGKTNVFIPIDHAFNRVGNKYIDITFEFALGFRPNAIRICGVWGISGGRY